MTDHEVAESRREFARFRWHAAAVDAWLQAHPEHAQVHIDENNGDTFRLSTGSFVKCSTASDQANIEGSTLHLAFLEESQDMHRLPEERTVEHTRFRL